MISSYLLTAYWGVREFVFMIAVQRLVAIFAFFLEIGRIPGYHLMNAGESAHRSTIFNLGSPNSSSGESR